MNSNRPPLDWAWPRRRATAAAGVALALLTVAGCSPVPQAAPGADELVAAPTVTVTVTESVTITATPSRTATPDDDAPLAAALLTELSIKGRAPQTGYDRGQFGQRWADVDRNGCDQRNDVLNRDLTDVAHEPGTRDCVVVSGTLADPFTGTTIDFVRGNDTSTAVQIDHVVALSDAWQKGAQQLDAAVLELFANDPLNLLAVDGPTNGSKGDGDAATWLPPNKAFRCDYVARQVAVKHKYQLWVTAPERAAMDQVLGSCPGQTVPVDETVPTPTASPTPAAPTTAAPAPATTAAAPAPATAAPAPATTAAAPVTTEAPPPPPPPVVEEVEEAPPADAYYKNCDAVRAAGRAPLLAGEPGYRKGLDRDGDGVACE